MAGMTSIIMMCLTRLHEGLVLLKDLTNPLRPNRTYMSEKSFLKMCRGSYGSNTLWVYMGFSAIERLT
jgi:hypothetical protein